MTVGYQSGTFCVGSSPSVAKILTDCPPSELCSPWMSRQTKSSRRAFSSKGPVPDRTSMNEIPLSFGQKVGSSFLNVRMDLRVSRPIILSSSGSISLLELKAKMGTIRCSMDCKVLAQILLALAFFGCGPRARGAGRRLMASFVRYKRDSLFSGVRTKCVPASLLIQDCHSWFGS